MANRLAAPNQFETLTTALASNLDTNFTLNQGAWNDSSLGFVNGIPTDTGSANAYTVALPFGSPSAYQDGMCVVFIPANTNTGSSTITVSPLGSVAILNPAGNALQGGEIAANRPTLLIYKSAAPTGFRIVGPCPLSINLTGQSGNVTIECAGYTSVQALLSWTSGTNLVTTLAHLAQGVPVSLELNNVTGANTSFLITPTSPAGTAFTVCTALPAGSLTGQTTFNALTGVTINSARGLLFTGGAIGPLNASFSV